MSLDWNFKLVSKRKKKSTIHCTLYGYVYDSTKVKVYRLDKYEIYKGSK